jgi:hypothetical protein
MKGSNTATDKMFSSVDNPWGLPGTISGETQKSFHLCLEGPVLLVRPSQANYTIISRPPNRMLMTYGNVLDTSS